MSTGELETNLGRSLAAGCRAIAVVTDEEERALGVLERVADLSGLPIHYWSEADGADHDASTDLDALLRRIADTREQGLWVLLDPSATAARPSTLRRLRQQAQRSNGPAVVIVVPQLGSITQIPEVVVSTLELPTQTELEARLRWIGEQLEAGGQAGATDAFDQSAPRIARAALGLPLHVLDRLVAEATVEHQADTDAILEWVSQRKPVAVDRDGLLELAVAAPMDELGGLADYKAWLARRKLALDPAAQEAGIPPPRGAVLVGIQGCGKSLAARATAAVLDLPLLRLDPGKLFGGTVGESESNLRRTLATVDRMAPVVLWLDEVEKGLAGSDGSASDAGTTARVVGGLLTWLQERTRPVFVVATANDVGRMPPELLRRGRLDEVFFVDLPDAAARRSILDVHLRKRPARQLGETPPLADEWDAYATVVDNANGYSGAEIEAAVVEARLIAFEAKRPVSAADLKAAFAATVPLSQSHAEHVGALRGWASTRTRNASDSV
jgi:hypothetical protein